MDLIVDFPNRCTSSDQRPGRKAGVRFAPQTDVHIIYKGHSENMWYNAEDYRSFRTETKRTVQDVHERVRSLDLKHPADGLDPDATTGIENLLSPSIIRKSKASKMLYWRAVLAEQARQDQANECDPYRLALVAERCSRWSTRRAHAIGALQSS